jgi:hypothetical protein
MIRKLFVVMFILSLGILTCNAQILQKKTPRRVEKALFRKSDSNKKEVKVKEPRAVVKAKKKQEANLKKHKDDYDKSVERSKKRTIDIQSPEVQKRMKQDKKATAKREKIKRKNFRANSKKAGKKYN